MRPFRRERKEDEPEGYSYAGDEVAFGMSHVGARENNEDSMLVLRLPDAYLLAVADGLGGHKAGEVASQMAIDTLRETFEREYTEEMKESDVARLLKSTHEIIHGRIEGAAIGERAGMGTTLTSAFVRGERALISNTGDSRAWLIRKGSMIKRTRDHSLVQELVDKGEITEEEAKRHPLRNIVTKALGIELGVDLYDWGLESGDVLLLSTDGLHDYVEEETIASIVSKFKTPQEITIELIAAALPFTRDNVTVVVWKG